MKFLLKCKLSGYLLEEIHMESGHASGHKMKSAFSLNKDSAIKFEKKLTAERTAYFINSVSPAPLPYEFEGGTHVFLEVVKYEEET